MSPRYRRQIRPAEVDFISVPEWTPPDRSGGWTEPSPVALATRRRATARGGGAPHAAGGVLRPHGDGS